MVPVDIRAVFVGIMVESFGNIIRIVPVDIRQGPGSVRFVRWYKDIGCVDIRMVSVDIRIVFVGIMVESIDIGILPVK